MSFTTRSAAHMVEAMQMQHNALDLLIWQELRRPCPDSLRLAEWKRQKLRLKDEFTQMMPGAAYRVFPMVS